MRKMKAILIHYQSKSITQLQLNQGGENMDAKVLERFFDKHTGKEHKKGDVILNITQSRFEEINSKKKLVEAVDVAKKEEKK